MQLRGHTSEKDFLTCLLIKDNYSVSVGDEGGFAPDFKSNKECLNYILNAIEISNYKPGEDIFIALDIASSEFFKNKKYNLKGESKIFNSFQLIDYYQELINKYPEYKPSIKFSAFL